MVKRVQIYAAGTLWLFSNFLYMCLRAQGKKETEYIRIMSFLCGFPHTIISYCCIDFGSKNAFGIELPTNEDIRQIKSDIASLQNQNNLLNNNTGIRLTDSDKTKNNSNNLIDI